MLIASDSGVTPGPCCGRDTAAPFQTTRRRKVQTRGPRCPPLAGRVAGLSGGSSYSTSSHPSAANENRTCWHRRQKKGKGAPEAAVSSQRRLSAGGRTAPAAPKTRCLGRVFPAPLLQAPRVGAVGVGASPLQDLGGSFLQGPPRGHVHPRTLTTCTDVHLNLR